MANSYRIRTQLGVDKTISVNLEQEYEFLEILSLKLQQTDVYNRDCSNYGVLVGRVTANNGFGIPNARVSIFIPVSNTDLNNPIIKSIYPYRNPEDKNEDGYRYNLLPYEKSYSTHAATGTLPTRLDVLTNQTAIEIYDKYYKYTTKTNDSGDYMILGVPLGAQTIVMDLDLSDMGEFSLTPQDLIKLGIATEAQVAGNKFKDSTDLASLPQIVNLTKTIEINPLWGDETICQIMINRLDFDLRDDANIDIQPTAIFMGSIFSSADSYRIRKNSRPKNNLGNLCSLTTGPGQILAIRQTIGIDSNGNPVLEQYNLEQSGNVIDGNGTWLTEIPMNLDYVITNEFGEKVISVDPEVGIPTKAKYRFKIKWQQPNSLTEQVRRAYFLVPNVKEYGWSNSTQDPNYFQSGVLKQQQESSYYFGLDWTGYTNGFSGQELIDRLNEVVNCEDTFYEFGYNKVYTISQLIDQYKKGGRSKFIGIKEINNPSCESTNNKFPVNEAFQNFDTLYFLFSLVMVLFQSISISFIVIAHIGNLIYGLVKALICFICQSWVFSGWDLCDSINCDELFTDMKFPMITYPDCQACPCETERTQTQNGNPTPPDNPPNNTTGTGVLSFVSLFDNYTESLKSYLVTQGIGGENITPYAEMVAQALGGNNDKVSDLKLFKVPKSKTYDFNQLTQDQTRRFAFSSSLPVGERINLFNTRKSYFDNLNRIRVTFDTDSNNPSGQSFHFDNTIVVLANKKFEPGTLLSTVSLTSTNDTNNIRIEYIDDPTYVADPNNPDDIPPVIEIRSSITGTSISGPSTIQVSYANPNDQLSELSTQYILYTGSSITTQSFPMDREYFQVITAMTVADAIKIWDTTNNESFPNIITSPSLIDVAAFANNNNQYQIEKNLSLSVVDYFKQFDQQYVLILQRGVDPYSPKFNNEYRLGRIFGKSIDDTNYIVNLKSRLNIPIQKLGNGLNSLQPFSQSGMFYSSYFFTPGDQFQSFDARTSGYYGAIDANFTDISFLNNRVVGNVTCKITSTSNLFYSSIDDSTKYDLAEDIAGTSFMYYNFIPLLYTYDAIEMQYFSPNLYGRNFLVSDKSRNVMRTDRLPTSDKFDGQSWEVSGILQQNNNFQFYEISTNPNGSITEVTTGPPITTGAEQDTVDIEGLSGAGKILETFSCDKMVELDCYRGFGENLTIDQSCVDVGDVKNGCYVFLKIPIIDIPKDIINFQEWAYRYRFFYGICRGVIGESFTNNWVNGTFFAFPIQVDTYFDNNNQPYSRYSRELIYFDSSTTNLYYRSSPFNNSTKRFIGKDASLIDGSVNSLNLLFPTTIVDLGMKDPKYSEIILEPYAKAFIMDKLDSTSHGDTSDLINLFVISRMLSASFLAQIIGLGDGSISSLFSRNNTFSKKRLDGDITQLLSINSEIGVVKFSPEFYEITPNDPNPPSIITGTEDDPAIAVWFSSTTENLQTKDFLTPGRINLRTTGNQFNFPYIFGIKSQKVPFYSWSNTETNNIFGTQRNNWITTSQGIIEHKYQELDRTRPPYFQSTTSPNFNDLYQRGYIFSVDSNGKYSLVRQLRDQYLVGAPFHFYFGVVKGESALDRFKTKYLADE